MLEYKNDNFMEKNQNVSVILYKYFRQKHPPHTHEFLEFIYIQKGCGTHYINDIPYLAEEGDFLFIGYGQSHWFKTDSEMSLVNFLVKPEFFTENTADFISIKNLLPLLILGENTSESVDFSPIVKTGSNEKAWLNTLITKMLEENEQKHTASALALNGYMRVLCAYIFRFLCHQPNSQNEYQLTLPKITQFIEENYNTEFSVRELASKCFYNPKYLGRIFKQRYGKTIHEYLEEVRMVRSEELLINSHLTVSEICEKIGIKNAQQFYATFKRKNNCSPKEYRQKYGIKSDV